MQIQSFWKFKYFASKFWTPYRWYGKQLWRGLWTPFGIVEVNGTRSKRNKTTL